ncbi:metal ABC transporter solute-binding protein, Zn/Mn family [Billgrantia endophytica]|uniref:ABC transporter substrate-binding protein n=1 Tax=Billgrantia endophytica TaxID=2033802 RepID=A0A2N7TVU6_9GAMM|nr:zinc ABC transporter substrate-binding protein [Halomonas endophytica]PMR72288.1 ABC transporter substrate-binding protein [Halomonas endophytica]
MKKLEQILAISLLPLIWPISAQAEDALLKVSVTFSILGDLVTAVAGEDASVSVLTPAGAEVHEWELIPSNFMALEKADAVFYNGYNLEQWVGQIMATVREGVPVVALAKASGYPTQPIVTGDFAGDPDPHLWMDPRAAAAYAHAIADTLGEADPDPDAAERYRARAESLAESLHALHAELEDILSTIPDDQRLLITSEAAFSYFADAYGFEHDGIWGTNSEEEGAPRQLMRIVELVQERQPDAIFWESTISDRHVSGVARDTNVATAGPLYVDSLSEAGGVAPDYPSMMRHNATLLSDTLGGPR